MNFIRILSLFKVKICVWMLKYFIYCFHKGGSTVKFYNLMLSQPRVSPPELPFPREWTFHQTAIIVTHRNHLQRNSTMKITKLLRFQIWKFSQKRILAQIINNVSLIVAQLFSVLGVAIRNWECACHMGENKNTKRGGSGKEFVFGHFY